jgi:tetratricopeptide (TPR) repeat protein
VLAAQLIEGARPDVVSVPAQHLYRRAPDRSREDERLGTVWDAAARGENERDRVHQVIDAWTDDVALESPGVAILSDVEWAGEGGSPPLSLSLRAGTDAPWSEASARELIDRWDGTLEHPEDRRRLAAAIARRERFRMKREGTTRESLREAAGTYGLILERLTPGHVPTMVALAAVRDALGDRAGAVELTARALELEPDRPVALTNMSLFLSRDPSTLGEARALAERATRIRPDLARGWRRLEQVCEQMGDDQCVARARARLQGLAPRPSAASREPSP